MSAHVLIVSDDPQTAQVWNFIVSQKGMHTSIASTSDSTLLPADVELILIDSNFETMQVNQLIADFRAVTQIPIVVLLPFPDEVRILGAYNVWADEVIVKPVSPRLLQAKIAAWLRRA